MTSLLIIERGTVAVLLSAGGKSPTEVTRLGPGQFFGEMALVTGEKRQATVRAVTEGRADGDRPRAVPRHPHRLAPPRGGALTRARGAPDMLDEHADAGSATTARWT